jgi:hypothetical protein
MRVRNSKWLLIYARFAILRIARANPMQAKASVVHIWLIRPGWTETPDVNDRRFHETP